MLNDKLKRLWKDYTSFAVNKKKAIIVSAINAIILTFGTYFMNNSPLFTGENLDLYVGLDFFKNHLVNKEYVNDSVLLVNIAYDKQIAKKSIKGNTVGNTDVTDRRALIAFLKNIENIEKEAPNSYRYIFLDVRFEAGVVTESDSLLFETICNTPRIVIANHSDITLASDKLKEKAAFSDYQITLTANNFVRFQYLRDEGETMPLQAYHELYNDSICKYGWFFTCNEGLCHNTHAIGSILRLEDRQGQDDAGNVVIEPFYENLNKINNKARLKELIMEKYIVVGNLVDDKHDTFYGEIPGSVLVFSAYWALKNGDNLVKPWIVILFLILFFIISLSLFSQLPIIDRISWVRKTKSKVLRFVISFLGYSTVLLITTIVLYLCFGVISSIWVPALYFSIQKAYFTYKYIKV